MNCKVSDPHAIELSSPVYIHAGHYQSLAYSLFTTYVRTNVRSRKMVIVCNRKLIIHKILRVLTISEIFIALFDYNLTEFWIKIFGYLLFLSFLND